MEEALAGAQTAADRVHQLSAVRELRERHWGAGVEPTLDLEWTDARRTSAELTN